VHHLSRLTIGDIKPCFSWRNASFFTTNVSICSVFSIIIIPRNQVRERHQKFYPSFETLCGSSRSSVADSVPCCRRGLGLCLAIDVENRGQYRLSHVLDVSYPQSSEYFDARLDCNRTDHSSMYINGVASQLLTFIFSLCQMLRPDPVRFSVRFFYSTDPQVQQYFFFH